MVVDPDTVYGVGPRAYPYYGYRYGWEPGSPCFDMPYTADEVVVLDDFDEGEIRNVN